MGADMHARLHDPVIDYVDDPLMFMSEYGMEPHIDVTPVRDSEKVPDHVKDLMLEDVLQPWMAVALADALELAHDGMDPASAEGMAALRAVVWLRHWGGVIETPVEGIH